MSGPDHRGGKSLARFPVHLGRGGSAFAQGEFTGMAFYAEYEARTAGEGPDGRLVSLHRFSAPWDSWEMHPSGDELVVCTAGGLVLIQDIGGEECSLTLLPGDYAINPAGTLAHRRSRPWQHRSDGAVHHRRARHAPPRTP